MFASSRKESFSLQAMQIADACLVWSAFALASVLRWNVFGTESDGGGLGPIVWLLYMVVPFSPLLLELFGFYRNAERKKLSSAVFQICQAGGVMGAAVGAMVIIFQVDPSSRLVLGLGSVFSVVFIFLRFYWVRTIVRRRIANGAGRERVILAGTPKDIDDFLKEMPEGVTDYWEVVGRFDLDSDDPMELKDMIEKQSAERVIISPKNTQFEKVSQAVEFCDAQGLEVWVAANFIRAQVSRPAFDTLGGKPMLVLRSTPELSWSLLLKSLFDRCAASLIILLTSPLWVIAALGIKLTSSGPIFFKQARAGKYGESFKMWKFRTMVVDAEEKLAEVKETVGNQMQGPVFKVDNDPRVFPFARFLRKWSIDELPQLLNVLSGDMSLVGPRPLPVYEVKEFEKAEYRRRLSVKPGITCTWQAGGRNSITSFEEWVEMDLKYIDNWSLWLDFKILIMTIPAVLFGRGAK
ncbi:exopolysaccharide biosynthesis polyprenyl glycosylphosphotransferase [Rubritalea squalenifaciens DSM 18772]|uniref:Exopolysaccharide biosynthesis polyprenyl glycosylphosphotransferase n=1 Tax=Rubritalea squalenifaciens DSM 18772 TaxID=1123071 RepID=A0A1M6DIP4_9BACT|nr:sugar transferase [Rubritalea squalenifaciens]SHI73136.1 exopolysaccharide biosynthesis polyprenyl glycosylphosphotransferase [Rubritalea squalenifaciens DSM 18772]